MISSGIPAQHPACSAATHEASAGWPGRRHTLLVLAAWSLASPKVPASKIFSFVFETHRAGGNASTKLSRVSQSSCDEISPPRRGNDQHAKRT